MDDALARRLLSATPDALWVLGLDGSTLYGNQRLVDLLGRELDELTPESVFEVTDAQGGTDLARHLDDMRAGHPGRENDEVFIVRPDGTKVWTLVSWVPYRDETGEVVGYLHRLTEHTERRELLDRLSEREEELETAQAIAHLGSWTWDVASGAISWSPELFAIFGLPDDGELTYDQALAHTHPDERERVEGIVRTSLRDGTDYSYDGRIITAQGEERWIRARGIVDLDDDGAARRLHGTCQDITLLKRAVEEATEARERLMLFSAVADAANRSRTLDDALARAHQALRRHEGWRALAVWTRPDPEAEPHLLHDLAPSSGARTVGALSCWETGDVAVLPGSRSDLRTVWLPVRRHGRTELVLHLEARASHVLGSSRSLLEQASGTLSRVAEREQAAAELATARDDAMAASAHKSAFLANMSHEIRTPMNGVIGLTDLLLRTGLDAHQRRLADGLRGAGTTLLALLTDILDLSKIEAGAMELEHAPFDLHPLLDQVATIISPPAQEKRLELVLTCDPAVPATLLGDRVRLGQVLTNLASNAVKFTDQGEVVVELGLDPGSQPDRLLLRCEVRDTGIGIGSDAASLFEAFTQADRSTTRRHGGTGLGLAISRRLVRDMGGSIGADERPEGGSVFWFVVPVEPAPEDQQTPPLPRLATQRVLVVDDHPGAAAALERQLSAWGHSVEVVGSAEQAHDALSAEADLAPAFDLALVDLYLPDADGLDLGRSLAASGTGRGVSVALLSDDPSVTLAQAREAGFCCLVDKPVRTVELHAALVEASRCGAGQPTDESAAAAAATPEAPRRLDLHVLVVEDNVVNQLVAQGLLDRLGCLTTVAHNGEEAVAALAPGHPYDLVLMDCRMPRMDGYDATAAIREREVGARVPIIAMTASALAGERERCLAAGMDDFLTKPVDPVGLARVVHEWAERSADTHAPSTALAPTRTDVTSSGSSGTAPDAVPDLDDERVEMLRDLVRDGLSFFERTRASFLSRIDDVCESLRTARDRDDLAAVAAVAHQLKGSALNLGLTRVGRCAAAVEDAALLDDRSTTTTAIALLELAVVDGVRALRHAPGDQEEARDAG